MRRRHLVVSVVAGLALLSACDADPPAAAPIQPAAAPVQPVPSVSLNATEVIELGRVLTDQRGHTLYLFAGDGTAPPDPTCVGECARMWPPLLATGDVQTFGVEPKLVGSVGRPDGTRQVTVGGWPMYTFSQDTAPGQVKGHGLKDTWFAVTPEGKVAGAEERVELNAADIPGFGPALADQEGHTLYLFTEDDKEPSRSTCEEECVRSWPPLLVAGEDDVTLTGVDPALVGRVARDDGSQQVTVGGWPVYTHVRDTEPGQTTGHGAGGVWFVIEPAGCKSVAPVEAGTSY